MGWAVIVSDPSFVASPIASSMSNRLLLLSVFTFQTDRWLGFTIMHDARFRRGRRIGSVKSEGQRAVR